MNTSSPASLADRRTTLVKGAAVVGFAVALAAASQVAVPLPGTPVPLTLQPMLVVLAGLWLGPMAGAASMVLFLAAGAAGLPVFSPMGPPGILRLAGPTGGYLLAYPFAALVAGWVAQRTPSLGGRMVASLLGFATLFVGGVAQLAVITGSLDRAVATGLLPFVVPDTIKALVAALLAPARRRTAAR